MRQWAREDASTHARASNTKRFHCPRRVERSVSSRFLWSHSGQRVQRPPTSRPEPSKTVHRGEMERAEPSRTVGRDMRRRAQPEQTIDHGSAKAKHAAGSCAGLGFRSRPPHFSAGLEGRPLVRRPFFGGVLVFTFRLGLSSSGLNTSGRDSASATYSRRERTADTSCCAIGRYSWILYGEWISKGSIF